MYLWKLFPLIFPVVAAFSPRGAPRPTVILRARNYGIGGGKPPVAPRPPSPPPHKETLLKRLDKQIQEMNEKMGALRRIRREVLGNIPGLKYVNQTETHFKDSFSDDDDDYDDDLDEDEAEEFFRALFPAAGGGQPRMTGVRVFMPARPAAPAADEHAKSENFEVVYNTNKTFADIGGYETVKNELMQCADILVNYEKYQKFNVRTPKGIILEGPPGNGKTLMAKCFCGEINIGFIAVSGAQFQEKYVGVGASRIRELFKLAEENKPCVIFIDEIDALGRRRSSDDSSQNSERDSTLNELLVNLDGFHGSDGVFVIGSTNRVDLLDSALTRPGRIDKSVYIGMPNHKTRRAIINIHAAGKPMDTSLNTESLVELTQGFSGAQIENTLNEGMLYALRQNREYMTRADIDHVVNRVLVGWQSTENEFSAEALYKIAIHEIGHAIVGVFAPSYRPLVKVTLNKWSAKTPGFTLFAEEENELKTKEQLMSHLMVLLGGRIAEEVFFRDAHVTTGASHDLSQARGLAENMIHTYGMGSKYIFAAGEGDAETQYEVGLLLEEAEARARAIVLDFKEYISVLGHLLTAKSCLTYEDIEEVLLDIGAAKGSA